MKPDAVDIKILEVLMDDGRASLREIARRTSLTTPTISSRFARMQRAGLIKKFVPVLATDAASQKVIAIVGIKVAPSSAEKLAKKLVKMREVEAAYLTAGESNIVLKLALESVRDIHPFLRKNVLSSAGVDISSSHVVTNVVKDEPSPLTLGTLSMQLKCDYCGGDVSSTRPYTIAVGSSHYYFCCKICKKSYLDEHRARLSKLLPSLT